MKPKIAIEIGTSYTKIYKAREDVVLFEPTLIAIKNGNYKKPIAVGEEAEKLIGKTTSDIQIIRPVNNTEIVDFKGLTSMLNAFISKIRKKGEFIKDALLVVGCGSDRQIISNFEKALSTIKIYNVCEAESPILSLIGEDIPISSTSCGAIIDLGGGQTTICVLTSKGVISGLSAEIGGNTLDKMIATHCEKKLEITLSLKQIEILKKSVASLVEDDLTKIVCTGKDPFSGKTKTMNISASQIIEPVKEFADKIIKIAGIVLNKLPDEALIEINKNGIHLCGGGSNLYGIAEYLSSSLGFKCEVLSEPQLASIIGAGKLVEDKELLNKLKLHS